jgi:hypothetical protein
MRGGGVLLHNADVQFGNCSFISNKAFEGSALYSWLSTPSFDSCSFVGNGCWQSRSSVAINTLGRGKADFSQCQFKDNSLAQTVVVYPIELDTRRMSRRPRKANEQAVNFSHSTIQGKIGSIDSNLVVRNCELKPEMLYGFGGVKSCGHQSVWGPFDSTLDSRYKRRHLPASGRWSLGMSDCSISGTTSRAVSASGSDVTLDRVSIKECGGGLYVHEGHLVCNACTFDKIESSQGSAIIGWRCTIDLHQCEITNCTAWNCPISFPYNRSKGGALYLDGCETTMCHSIVENCYADHGGFLYLDDGSFKGDSNEIITCKANDGAVLYMCPVDGTFDSRNSTYSACTTIAERNLVIGSNRQSVFLFGYRNKIISVDDTYLGLHGSASDSGVTEAVVMIHGADVIYDGLRMSGCSSKFGDLLLIDSSSEVYLENSTICNNVVRANGHVVANSSEYSELHILECEFAGNIVKSRPGASALNAVVHSNGSVGGKMTTVADTHFCGNKMTTFDGPWTDNGGVTFSRRCASP